VSDESDDAEYVMRLIQARAPEVADLVVPTSILTNLLEMLYAIEERLVALESGKRRRWLPTACQKALRWNLFDVSTRRDSSPTR
jgi:hypothetical protein